MVVRKIVGTLSFVFDYAWLTVLTLCSDLALESVVGIGEKVNQWQIVVQ